VEPTAPQDDTITLRAEAMVAGGDALARHPDGRVVFVTGALPGELVKAAVGAEKKGYSRASLIEVLEASPARVAAPCPAVEAGCGGCQWQHIDPTAQLPLKRDILLDALRRIAHVGWTRDVNLVDVKPVAQRTTVHMGVVQGRAGFRAKQSRDVVDATACEVVHPLIAELIETGRFTNATDVTFRAGAATGERLVIAAPRRTGVHVPEGVEVVTEQEVQSGREAAVHDDVAGRRWRISALSFFQSGPVAADALATEVVRVTGDALAPGATVVDLYAGVGLLGGAVAARVESCRLVSVESSASAVGDARANLRDLDATVVRRKVSEWKPRDRGYAVAIADPARSGLGRPGAAAVGRTGAPLVVLVGCDPASFARDTALLAELGYRLHDLSVVDCFPHTPHLEAVGAFRSSTTLSD
jgi:23S rRNA (uracil1939-C5)-methyltransferase